MNDTYSLYWIGVRESEIADTKWLFKGSITTFGTNEKKNYAFDKVFGYRFDCNLDHEEWLQFVNNCVEKIIAQDANCRFLLYYPADFNYYSENVKQRVVCFNDPDITMLLEDKIKTKLWLSEDVPIPPFLIKKGESIRLDLLQNRFPGYDAFVVQANSSCGGTGTWLFNKSTAEAIDKQLAPSASYMIAPYMAESVSLNIHLIIYSNEIVLLPASIQLIHIEDNCFCYRGADFITYKALSTELQGKVTKYAYCVGEKLRVAGYRGVCGIDFIATQNEVFFMEVNSRFQASTILINRAFKNSQIENSVQQMHLEAFFLEKCTEFSVLDIDLSYISYSYHENEVAVLKQLFELHAQKLESIDCIHDRLNWAMELQKNTYLFSLIFQHNITAISPSHTCIWDPNIEWDSGLFEPDGSIPFINLKIMLMNQGIRLSKDVLAYTQQSGGLNYQEFMAVDIIFDNRYINVPYNTCMCQISPFHVERSTNNKLDIYHWDTLLGAVSLRSADTLGDKITQGGFAYKDITYLGNDRLRVYHRNSCYYKNKKLGCMFCDIVDSDCQFELQDVKEVLDAYQHVPNIRHYLIGGGSAAPQSDFTSIIQLAVYIKQQANKPICLMTTPTSCPEILRSLHHSGVTEITFNLEVFDRSVAKKYMPGKGFIPLAEYKTAFQEAVKLWGKTGNVRSIFIVGLETKESLLEGINYVCELGVSPTLSLFKPIDNTPLRHMLPPSNTEILDIYTEANNICRFFGLELGPQCVYCQDNVLKA